MAFYVVLTKLTSDGAKTLHKNPERIGFVNREIEEFGCKVVEQFATLGQYDFVSIVKAPDNQTVMHMAIDLSSRGTAEMTTLPAITVRELLQGLKSGHKLGKE
ncbi:MAG: GYD domain-containing protein [Gammaproteobacteria bacterium]